MGYERRAFGRYQVIARLGRGGMGQVFLAMNAGPAGVQKLVVIKQLRDDLASSPVAREMFLDEARIAALLQHPNVVQTYEVIDDRELRADGDDLYIVMEYLDGRSLARSVEGEGAATLSLPLRLRVLADVLAALHYAHERTDYDGTPLGVVHRDVSPQNIFLTYDGHVKLVDFGIAKAANATAHTATGLFKGKVRYAAPEQALGMTVDRRADVYAVGAVLWESLTGAKLWKDMGEATILFALASGKIPSVREAREDVPEELAEICAKALARDPAERFATASDFRLALLDYLHRVGDASTERDLAAALDSAFRDRRRELQGRIEAQIRAAREAMASSAAPPSLPRLSTDSFHFPTPVTGPVPSAVPPPTAMSDAPVAPPSAPPAATPVKKGRGGWAFAVIAAAAVAGVSLLRPPLRRALWTATGAAGAPPSAAPAAPAAASASPPGARRVHVSLRADPPAARFFLDGAPLGTNPYEGEMATDEQAHALTVRADGFDPRALPVRLTADVDVVVALTPLGARGSLAASPPAPHRTLPSPVRTSHEVVPTRPTRAIDEDDPYSDNPYDSGR